MPEIKPRAASICMFVLDDQDNIVGEKRIPSLILDGRHVLCTDELRKQFRDASLAHMADGRTDRIKCIRTGAGMKAKSFEIPTDPRPMFSIDIKKAAEGGRKRIMADGVESVTIEVTKHKGNRGNGNGVDTTFDGEVLIDVGWDRELSFNFVKGVATKEYKTLLPGRLDFRNAGKQKIRNPDSLVLVE